MTSRAARTARIPPRLLWYRDLVLLASMAVILTLDQLSKFLVRQWMEPGQLIPTEGLLRLHYITNTGIAFGLLRGQTPILTLASLGGIAVLILFYHSQPTPSRLVRMSLGLLLGGAFGNLLDRLFLQGVTDFIKVGWWPVFNLADSSIVVGMTILATVLLFPKSRQEAHERAPIMGSETLPASDCADGGVPLNVMTDTPLTYSSGDCADGTWEPDGFAPDTPEPSPGEEAPSLAQDLGETRSS